MSAGAPPGLDLGGIIVFFIWKVSWHNCWLNWLSINVYRCKTSSFLEWHLRLMKSPVTHNANVWGFALLRRFLCFSWHLRMMQCQFFIREQICQIAKIGWTVAKRKTTIQGSVGESKDNQSSEFQHALRNPYMYTTVCNCYFLEIGSKRSSSSYRLTKFKILLKNSTPVDAAKH